MRRHTSVAVLFVLLTGSLGAQTPISAPSNKYTPAQDVQLGRQAAAEVERQVPLLSDRAVASYVTGVGRRLAGAVPPRFRHSEFRYSFKVVNTADINAFALPGGPMYIHRGMIEAAGTEAEMAGVMAHELAHVALRHGTAQASRATKYELGALGGAILGAILGGRVGNIVSEGTRFGLGTAFMRFSREFERQADMLGAQILARAGYDPRQMAVMFQTIEREQGRGGPEWLSDHPSPGNRYDAISKEAQSLGSRNGIRNTRAFDQTQARLRRLPPAQSLRATR